MVRVDGDKAIIKKIPALLNMQGSVKIPEGVKNLTWKEIEKRAHDKHGKQGAS